jgi:hypothetical protein
VIGLDAGTHYPFLASKVCYQKGGFNGEVMAKIPASNALSRNKSQAKTKKQNGWALGLGFGAWVCVGIWSLELGICLT